MEMVQAGVESKWVLFLTANFWSPVTSISGERHLKTMHGHKVLFLVHSPYTTKTRLDRIEQCVYASIPVYLRPFSFPKSNQSQQMKLNANNHVLQ